MFVVVVALVTGRVLDAWVNAVLDSDPKAYISVCVWRRFVAHGTLVDSRTPFFLSAFFATINRL